MACLIEMLLGIHRTKFPSHKVTQFEVTSYRQHHPIIGVGGEVFDYYKAAPLYEANAVLEKLDQLDARYLNATMKNNDEITIGPLPMQDGSYVRVIGCIKRMSADTSGVCTLNLDVRHVVSDRGTI